MPENKTLKFSLSTPFGSVRAGWLRVQPLMHIARTIGDLGGDARQIFADQGIPDELFANPENSMSLEAIGTLLEHCVAMTHCEHFGLLLGAGAIGNPFGLLGEVLDQCADVGTAIAHFHQYYHLHDRGGMATRTIEGGSVALGYSLFQMDGPGIDQIFDTAIAVGMVLMRHLCGPKWRPTTVLLPRRRPTDVKPYRQAFGCMPEFNAERAALVFPTADLTRLVRGADPERYALLSERLQTVASEHDLKFSDQVSRVVRGLVALRRCSLDEVATLFGMNPRRVNRMLEREGTTYRKIVQEALRTLAERLMVDTDMPLVAVSAVLNYADASAFTRAFRNWHGCSPSEWRRAHARQAKGETGVPL